MTSSTPGRKLNLANQRFSLVISNIIVVKMVVSMIRNDPRWRGHPEADQSYWKGTSHGNEPHRLIFIMMNILKMIGI